MSQRSTIFNESYQRDINYSIETCRVIASFLGLWPNNAEKSPIQKILKLIIIFTSYLLMTFVIGSSILFGTFELKDLSQKVEITGPTSFYVMAFMKYSLILLRGAEIKNCFKYVEEDWKYIENEDQREVMLKNAKFGRYITLLCATFMYAGGFWYHVLQPLFSDSIVTEKNITVKPFPSPVYGKFLTSGYSPIYEIVYGADLIAGFIMYSTAVVAFSFAAILTIHACGQFEIVILYLNDIVAGLGKAKNSVHYRLIIAVNSHLRVLRFVSQLESLFNEICLIEVMGCTLNICLLGYYTIMGWKKEEELTAIMFSILLVSFIFNIFIYCYIGEMLTMQGRKVGEQGYMIEWYRLPKNTSLDLLLFIKISQSPPKISAGKIVILSLTTFSTVIKSSAAYLNALWKMSQ